MASAIKKILLKKGMNAAGKSGLGFIFDERDNKNILLFYNYDSLLSGDVFSKQLLLINNQLITRLIFFSIRNHSFASRYKQPILQTMNKGKNNFCASYVSCKHI